MYKIATAISDNKNKTNSCNSNNTKNNTNNKKDIIHDNNKEYKISTIMRIKWRKSQQPRQKNKKIATTTIKTSEKISATNKTNEENIQILQQKRK